MIDHRVRAQAVQLQGSLGAQFFALGGGQRLPVAQRQAAQRAAGGQADAPEPGVKPGLQQAWLAGDQHAAVQALHFELAEGLPDGIRRRPAARSVRATAANAARQGAGQDLSDGLWQLVQPGVG